MRDLIYKRYPAVQAETQATCSVKPDFVREHFEELMDMVNREDVELVIPTKRKAVFAVFDDVHVVPYWRICYRFGTDVKQVLEMLFQHSSQMDGAEIIHCMGLAMGYIQLTTPESAREITDILRPQVKGHLYEHYWAVVVRRLDTYWDADHEPELLLARYVGSQMLLLLFTDGTTRMVDMRPLVRNSQGTEDSFRAHLTQRTGVLVWEEGKRRIIFSSRYLLQAGIPVKDSDAKKMWNFPDKMELERWTDTKNFWMG